MRIHKHALLFLVLLAPGLVAGAQAQTIEIHPYAGGFFTDGLGNGEVKNEGLYGIKGGIFLTRNFQLEGNFGYINHFELDGTDPESRGLLWEAAGAYHFSAHRFRPYVTAGLGGLTAVVDRATIPPGSSLSDNDTFFNFSYGGGIKAHRLWGPVGLRADVRGRTLPNYFGESTTWLETTGGITLTWGN